MYLGHFQRWRWKGLTCWLPFFYLFFFVFHRIFFEKRDPIDSKMLCYDRQKDREWKICRRGVCLNPCFALVLSLLAPNTCLHAMFRFWEKCASFVHASVHDNNVLLCDKEEMLRRSSKNTLKISLAFPVYFPLFVWLNAQILRLDTDQISWRIKTFLNSMTILYLQTTKKVLQICEIAFIFFYYY